MSPLHTPTWYRAKLERLKGNREQIQSDLNKAEQSVIALKKSSASYVLAKTFVQEISIKTQEKLQYHINDITSLALEAVFKNPYKLEMEFVQRRNKTECDLYFSRGGEQVDPIEASGGGAVDIAAFALRIASWSLNRPHTRPVILLDEPMRFVSEDLQEKASLMIKEVSNKLGIQFIIITHEPTLTLHADKIFTIKQRKGVSVTRVD